MSRHEAVPTPPPARRPPARRLLVSGGGTGGHVFPALAVAEELRARGWQVTFVGSGRELEVRLVAEGGFPYVALAARPLLGRGRWGQVRSLVTVARSTLAARRLVRRLSADGVVGTGGYASAPAVLGARLAGRASLLVEPNAHAGVANRWLSRWASGAAVGYAETAAEMRCAAWVTGVPVRAAFFALPEPPEEGPPHLLVLGGSQGSRDLNRVLPRSLAAAAAEVPRLTVLHQAGAGKVEESRGAYVAAGFVPGGTGGLALSGVEVEVVPFVDDVAGAMAAAHLVVSRAGALTVAEIAAAGRASVLVPLALAGGHQLANAHLLEAAGAARVVAPEELSAERLGGAIAGLAGGRDALVAAGRAARALARPGAAAAIADRIETLVERAGGRR